MLCGCVSIADPAPELDQVFSADMKQEKIRRNNYSTYIDYYLPSDTSELEGGKLSDSFTYHNSTFIMDVNISGIINEKYYPSEQFSDEGFFDRNKLQYSRQGTYVDADGESHEYLYRVYRYDEKYLTYFVSRDLIFYGYASEDDLVGLSSRILLMAKGAEVRHNDVVANYSLRDEIDYEKKQINLFETIMPVNGNVNEFMIGDKQEESPQ